MQVKAAKIVERETPERAVSLYEKAADTVRNAFYCPAFFCLELVEYREFMNHSENFFMISYVGSFWFWLGAYVGQFLQDGENEQYY